MATGNDLLAIYEFNRRELAIERARRPTACPNDGTQLVEGARGVWRCTFDGWEYPRDYNPIIHTGL
jgi:hypothetical protein